VEDFFFFFTLCLFFSSIGGRGEKRFGAGFEKKAPFPFSFPVVVEWCFAFFLFSFIFDQWHYVASGLFFPSLFFFFLLPPIFFFASLRNENLNAGLGGGLSPSLFFFLPSPLFGAFCRMREICQLYAFFPLFPFSFFSTLLPSFFSA